MCAYSYSIIDKNLWNKLSFKEKEKMVFDCEDFEDGLVEINKKLKLKI